MVYWCSNLDYWLQGKVVSGYIGTVSVIYWVAVGKTGQASPEGRLNPHPTPPLIYGVVLSVTVTYLYIGGN